MKSSQGESGNLPTEPTRGKARKAVAPKNPDSAFDHGKLFSDMQWVKDHLKRVEGNDLETRKQLHEARDQISDQLKAAVGTLNKSIEDLTTTFRTDILTRATEAAGKVEEQAKKDEATNNRFHALERKHAVMAALVAIILAMLGGKVLGLPWLV